MRVYRRPRDDSDEYSSLAQKVNVNTKGNGGDSEDSLATDSEEEEVTTSSEHDEFDDSRDSNMEESGKRSKRRARHQKMSTMIRHPTASRLDCLKDIEQGSSDTEFDHFDDFDEEKPLQFGRHHKRGSGVSGRTGVLSPVSALSQIKSRFSQLSDMSAAPIRSHNLGDSSIEIQGLINV